MIHTTIQHTPVNIHHKQCVHNNLIGICRRSGDSSNSSINKSAIRVYRMPERMQFASTEMERKRNANWFVGMWVMCAARHLNNL